MNYLIRIDIHDINKELEVVLDAHMHEKGFIRSTRVTPKRIKEYTIITDLFLEEVNELTKGCVANLKVEFTLFILDRDHGKSLFFNPPRK